MLQWLAKPRPNQVNFKKWGQVPSETFYGGESILKHTAILSHSSLAFTVFHSKIFDTHKKKLETGKTIDTGIYLVPSIENWISLKEINWCNVQEQGLQAHGKLTVHLVFLNYTAPEREQLPCIKVKSFLQA